MIGRGGPARAAVLLGTVAPLLLAACSDSTSIAGGESSVLGQVVVATGPAGYRVAVDHALSVEDVATATSSEPRALARTLQRTDFDGGWSRVWTSGDAYLSIVVVAAGTAFGAQELQQFQAQQLSGGSGVVAYPDADVPGARAFDFYGLTRQGGRQVFCQGVLFSIEALVFTLNDCNSAPRAADRVLAVARAQYVRAAGQLGVSVASGAPSPS